MGNVSPPAPHTMKPADEERFSALLAWAHAHGGHLHPALEVYKDDVTGFAMRVRQKSHHDQTQDHGPRPHDELLACPLATSLSYLSALQDGQPAFPPDFMALPPHIIARFFLVQQYLLGPSSFWYPYIATLPQPDVLSSWALPPFWPQDDASFLDETNTGTAATEIHHAVKQEYKNARRILKNAAFDGYQDYTNALYTWAFCMFTSRSFRSSLVIPASVWRAANTPDRVQVDDSSVLLPVFDIINHSMRAQVRWLAEEDGDPAITCRFQTLDTYDQPGQQIFNNYGLKTNSELLLSYGFVLPETPDFHNDYIHLRKKEQHQDTTETAALPAGQTCGSKPTDFLVSLRPMNHPSSLAGQRRQLVAKDPDFDIRPEFAHIEDGLVWYLCLMVVGEANKASFMDQILATPDPIPPTTTTSSSPCDTRHETKDKELACLGRILSTAGSQSLSAPVAQVVAQVQEILLGKLGQEYDKLCASDPGVQVDEDGNEVVVQVVPQTNNQKLALAYRSQVKKVLEAAIAALVPDWQPGADG